jgi:hypothetical protein
LIYYRGGDAGFFAEKNVCANIVNVIDCGPGWPDEFENHDLQNGKGNWRAVGFCKAFI